MHKASAFLSNLSSQPCDLWPSANTQCWPVTHNAEMQCQVTLWDQWKRPPEWRHPHCLPYRSCLSWQLPVNIFPLPAFPSILQTNWAVSNEEPIAATWIMVMSFRLISETVSTCNVLKEQQLWRAMSVRRFCTCTWALLTEGRTHRCPDMALSDSMGFSFSTSQYLLCRSYDRGIRASTGFLRVCFGWVGCCSWRTEGELWSIRCNHPPPNALTHGLFSQ